MPIVCAVADCRNVQRPGSSVPFHRFPADNSIRKAWIVRCKIKDTVNPVTARICSDHFGKEDYEKDSLNKILGLPVRKILKQGVIPSIFRNRGCSENKKREERVASRENRNLEREVLKKWNSENQPVDDQAASKQHKPCNFSCQVNFPDVKLQKENTRLKLEVKRLRESMKTLKNRIAIYSQKEKRRKSMRTNNVFSVAQIKKLRGQKRVNWGPSDIVKALSLRSTSIKAYETARSVLNLPLPGASTLRSYVRRFNCSPGLQNDIIRILKEHSPSLGKLSRLCAISFDEMSLDARYILDPLEDKITSHSKVQVIMARGIVQPWKQPLYYAFDTPMTKEILFEVICSLESAGIHVVSMTSDLGGENRGLWKTLNISPEKTWFENPAQAGKRIFVFADMPHLLKLIRNHILDDGLMTNDGTVVDKTVLQALVDCDSSELKLCPKLSLRVRPAAQLLSHHTATLAKILFEDAHGISDFIQLVNDGFDIFNSRCQNNARTQLLSAFGTNLDEQQQVLTTLKTAMTSIRFYMPNKAESNRRLKSAMLPCHVGYLISIQSLLDLYSFLKNEYGLQYLITCRLNQDSLESFFSRVRGFGGPNNNPTPAEFRYKFRLIILGGSARAPCGVNTLEHCSENYVSSELLKQNNFNSSVNRSETTFEVMDEEDTEGGEYNSKRWK